MTTTPRTCKSLFKIHHARQTEILAAAPAIQWMLSEKPIRALASRWPTPEVTILESEADGTRLERADVLRYLANALPMRPRARDVFEPLVGPFGEFLPLRSDAELSLFVPNVVLPAIDVERSSILRGSTGFVLRIIEAVVDPRVVGDVGVFCDALNPLGIVYFADWVVEAVTRANLDGVVFKKVWPK